MMILILRHSSFAFPLPVTAISSENEALLVLFHSPVLRSSPCHQHIHFFTPRCCSGSRRVFLPLCMTIPFVHSFSMRSLFGIALHHWSISFHNFPMILSILSRRVGHRRIVDLQALSPLLIQHYQSHLSAVLFCCLFSKCAAYFTQINISSVLHCCYRRVLPLISGLMIRQYMDLTPPRIN